jgi:hypothetical protein
VEELDLVQTEPMELQILAVAVEAEKEKEL